MITAGQYFNSLEKDRKPQMEALRQTILNIFPGVLENMDYKLPTYTYKKMKVCAIASQKNYMALYIMNYDLLIHFEEALANLNCGKSCIRFRNLDEKTHKLFQEILLYIKDNITNSQFSKR